MHKSTHKRDYFAIWEVVIFAAVMPALVYGILAINNVPIA